VDFLPLKSVDNVPLNAEGLAGNGSSPQGSQESTQANQDEEEFRKTPPYYIYLL